MTSCVIKPTFTPQMPTVTKIEQTPLPIKPASMPIPVEIEKDGYWVMPLEAGSCTPAAPVTITKPCPAKSGILESEAHAIKDQQYRISYDELRQLYEADIKVWGAQRELYEATLKQQQETIEKLQPSWYDQNALTIGLVGGFLLGTLTITGILVLSK